jgi:amino acid transporter
MVAQAAGITIGRRFDLDLSSPRRGLAGPAGTVGGPMSIVWASVIVTVVAAVAIAAMLLVRRRAPEGSYFEDGDRAAGVFGVLATGFAVLAGFVVFLAFESYDTSRSGAEAEARIVAHQFETVQLLPAPARERLSGELVCYARSVVHQEWPRMTSGTLGNGPNRWGVALFRSLRATQPRSASEQAAYAKYLDERSDREDARADRTHGAEGVIPTPLWIVLLLSTGILFVFMLFFADSGERAVVQSTLMGGVMILVSSLLLLLWFLDNPYHGGVGALRPVAMEGTLKLLNEETRVVGALDAPCDEAGSPSG